MKCKKLYGTVTVGTKGQVVIPVDARDELNIQTGDKLYVVGSTHSGFLGFLKEEELRSLIEHLTDNVQQYKDTLDKLKKD